MAYQAVFKRYEMKYMMTRRQKKAVLEAMLPYMKLDEFGHTTIRNVYFDTDNYILVRHSIEKPVYKEKLRIRSYKQAGAQDKVFIELKKKYDDVVYKRRESLSQLETLEWLVSGTPFPKATQIGNEIDYFFRLYQTLKPKVFLSYEREAFYAHVRPGEICHPGLTDVQRASSESLLGSNAHVRPGEICQPGLT
ncbi:MAG: polyphosphate polymerase domain-containing protein, partial [Lachnospiraceae bacterium]